MKLARIKLTNFRCFKNEAVNLSAYTSFIGPNNVGKSTVLKAIDLFFKTTQKHNPLTLSDFNDTEAELKIELGFVSLNDEAKKEFDHYFRHDQVEFFMRATAEKDGAIHASIHGERLGIADFCSFFAAAKAPEKKNVYKLLCDKCDLPKLAQSASVDVFASALAAYEAEHIGDCVLIPSEDLAFGVAGVASKIRKYMDWVYIPAVKDAADENEESRNNALGTLVNRIIRANVGVEEKIDEIRKTAHNQISSLMGDYQKGIERLQGDLDAEFRRLTSSDAHVELHWADLCEKNVGIQLPLVKSKIRDETFLGEVSEFGHGLQRSYLMALVQLNAKLNMVEQPSIVLGIEEPELYQHPPQARYLHSVLAGIANTDQVLITTHSPYFVSAKTFESIRVVRKTKTNHSTVESWTADEHRQLIAAAYGIDPIGAKATAAALESFMQPELSEAFFCSKLVMVEGLEDKAILETVLEVSGLSEDFRRHGGIILAVDGKPNLINVIGLARGFKTPYFVVFDADTGGNRQQIAEAKGVNEKVLKLMEIGNDEAVCPAADVIDERLIVWKTDIQGAIAADFSDWRKNVEEVCAEYGWSYSRLKKNPAVLTQVLTAVLKKQEIPVLKKAAEAIQKFAVA